MNQNHGVLSGFLTYKMIEEIFIQGKSDKYRLDAESFQKYKELILLEDVARAALAISMHELKYDKESGTPDFMPLSFSDYPLTFILIMADSLQEYLRWEGRTIRGDTKLTGFPSIRVTAKPSRITVKCGFSIAEEPEEQGYFCNEVARMMTYRGWISSGNTVREAANDFCRMINEDMGNKIVIGARKENKFTIILDFFEGKMHLCTHTLLTTGR